MVERELASLEKDWDCFKTLIKEAAKDCCGSTKVGGSRKTQTAWWTDEMKGEVLKKKELWRKYLNTKDQSDYNVYKEPMQRVKIAVREAKRKTWEDFGHFTESSYSENVNLFYCCLLYTSRCV